MDLDDEIQEYFCDYVEASLAVCRAQTEFLKDADDMLMYARRLQNAAKTFETFTEKVTTGANKAESIHRLQNLHVAMGTEMVNKRKELYQTENDPNCGLIDLHYADANVCISIYRDFIAGVCCKDNMLVNAVLSGDRRAVAEIQRECDRLVEKCHEQLISERKAYEASVLNH